MFVCLNFLCDANQKRHFPFFNISSKNGAAYQGAEEVEKARGD